jgi:hypothetical protein
LYTAHVRLELVVPTVPWRLPSLLELLGGLARQKVKPHAVNVILDGHDDALEAHVRGHLESLAIRPFRILRGAPGPGARWELADSGALDDDMDDDVLVASLDDDMVPGPLYVQNTLAAWARLGEPFSWCGNALESGTRPSIMVNYIRISANAPDDVRLAVAGAGGFVVPRKLLRGISEDKDAARYFAPHGHDEALVSWWLAQQGVRVWRPRGIADVREHVLAHDKRSQWNTDGSRCYPLVVALEARGWPIVDPIRPDPYARFRGRPLEKRK